MAVSKKRKIKKKVDHYDYNFKKDVINEEGAGNSKEYKMSLYLGFASLIGAYIIPIVGFIAGIFGWQNGSRAVKLHKERKLPLIINIIGTCVSGIMLMILFSMPRT